MVVYLYRWKLKAGTEQQFQDAWAVVTKELRDKAGSLGSRLHKGDDGLFYGYAQWPSRDSRAKANLSNPEIDRARSVMKDSTQEALPVILLDPLADFLVDKAHPNASAEREHA